MTYALRKGAFVSLTDAGCDTDEMVPFLFQSVFICFIQLVQISVTVHDQLLIIHFSCKYSGRNIYFIISLFETTDPFTEEKHKKK